MREWGGMNSGRETKMMGPGGEHEVGLVVEGRGAREGWPGL